MASIIHVQPALPAYRLDFFERLRLRYGIEVEVYYTAGSLGILTESSKPEWATTVGPIRSLPGGFEWQSGVAGVPIKRGDIVVLSGNPRQLSTLVVLLRARVLGARVIWWGHYWSSTSRRWRQVLRYLPMVLADALLFYTDEEVGKFRSDPLRFRKKRIIAALNNGIDLEPIRVRRKLYDAATREPALMFIGRLTAKAELGLAFKALARVGSPELVFHIVGDGEMRQCFQAQAESLGLSQQIVWHGAMIDEDRIAAVANRCQAFLYPGAVGLSLIHAMGYGLPAILHDQRKRHMPEIAAFRDGVTGCRFRHGNEYSLAATIATLMADKTELDRLSSQVVSAIGPDFTTEGMAERFGNLVDKLRDWDE